jgi:uncharacterized Tic20 family protein
MDAIPPIPQPPNVPQPSSGLTDRQWALFMHLSGLFGFAVIGIGNIVGPLVLWLVKKPESTFLERVGREVLNFQISFSIYMLIASVLIWAFVGFLLAPVVGITWLVLTILGAVKASNGEEYRFPLTIRFL